LNLALLWNQFVALPSFPIKLVYEKFNEPPEVGHALECAGRIMLIGRSISVLLECTFGHGELEGRIVLELVGLGADQFNPCAGVLDVARRVSSGFRGRWWDP